MISGIIFRKLKADESGLYRKIRYECLNCYPQYFGSTNEDENKLQKLLFEKYIANENPDHFMVGAFHDNNLIGICGFDRQIRTKTKHRGEIVQMYVKSDYSNNKTGTNLLAATIQLAFSNVEIEQLTLSFVDGNLHAEQMYLKAGFAEYGMIKNYFKSGDQYSSQRFMILYK